MFENDPNWVRVLFVYLAPFLLLLAPTIYAYGEYANWKESGEDAPRGTKDGVLFFGAVVWAVGSFVSALAIMYSSWNNLKSKKSLMNRKWDRK